ncbi:response regulator transcription factor [Candidatus Bipolaricaulota bacterium]|nr:response regulator transcription factor [Candidatus Bipolaricaulota bacterium]
MKQIRVAIADDHTLVRAGLVRLLSSYPAIEVVGTAKDGAAAIELAKDEQPAVFLLDMAMPQLNGLAAIPYVKTVSPKTRILILSMYDEAEYAQAALEKGAAGLVSKTISADDLYTAIVDVAQGKRLSVKKPLTAREREVVALLADGKTTDQIGSSLGISTKTVGHHCQRAMEKLDIHTRAGLISYAGRTAGLNRDS